MNKKLPRTVALTCIVLGTVFFVGCNSETEEMDYIEEVTNEETSSMDEVETHEEQSSSSSDSSESELTTNENNTTTEISSEKVIETQVMRVELVTDRKFNTDENINKFITAAKNRDLELLEELIHKGIDVGAYYSFISEEERSSLFQYFILEKDFESLKFLIELGVPLWDRNGFGAFTGYFTGTEEEYKIVDYILEDEQLVPKFLLSLLKNSATYNLGGGYYSIEEDYIPQVTLLRYVFLEKQASVDYLLESVENGDEHDVSIISSLAKEDHGNVSVFKFLFDNNVEMDINLGAFAPNDYMGTAFWYISDEYIEDFDLFYDVISGFFQRDPYVNSKLIEENSIDDSLFAGLGRFNYWRDHDMLETLIQHGYNVNQGDRYGHTICYELLHDGDFNQTLVKYKEYGIDITVLDNEGKGLLDDVLTGDFSTYYAANAYFIAMETDNQEVKEYLLNNQEYYDSILSDLFSKELNKTAIDMAIDMGLSIDDDQFTYSENTTLLMTIDVADEELIDYMIANGASKDRWLYDGYYISNALNMKPTSGEKISFLEHMQTKYGYDLTLANPFLMEKYVKSGNKEMIKYLLQYPTNLDIIPEGELLTLMGYAINSSLSDQFTASLVQYCKNVNYTVPEGSRSDQGYTLLHYAAKTSKFVTLKALIEAGADVNPLTSSDYELTGLSFMDDMVRERIQGILEDIAY